MDLKLIDKNAYNSNIEYKTFIKMKFIYNAIQDGWTVKKREDTYVFRKKHEGKRQVFKPDYLDNFIETNLKL